MSDGKPGQIETPIFIVSPPRSGSTLLFQTLAHSPDLFTVGGESRALIEGISGLHPRERGWSSNRLRDTDARPEIANAVRHRFWISLRDRDGLPPQRSARMLEKTPKNSLRIPFLRAIFPDAKFVFLYRDARETLASMMEAWSSGKFRTYPRLPDWPGLLWSLVLVPDWRDLAGQSLAHIAAEQWARTMKVLMDDLGDLPREQIVPCSYAALLADPQATISRLAAQLGVRWDQKLGRDLPLSPTVLSQPRPQKWRSRAAEIASVEDRFTATEARARRYFESLENADGAGPPP